MRSWKISPQLRYDVGVEVSPASDHMLQDVLHGLSKAMAATENDAGTYLVVPNDPARQDKLALMLLLEQKRVVEQSGEDEWSLFRARPEALQCAPPTGDAGDGVGHRHRVVKQGGAGVCALAAFE